MRLKNFWMMLGVGAVASLSACSSNNDTPGTSTGGTGSATASTSTSGGGDAGGTTGAASTGTTGATTGAASTGATGGTTAGTTGAASTGTTGSNTDGGAPDAGTGGTTGAGTGGTSEGGTRETGAGDGSVSPLFSFFVTSTGSGANGGNLGGLNGADTTCQTLAAAVGAGSRTWHAYLSVNTPAVVNARDRIGTGPWYNVKGVKIADNLVQLHEEGDSGTNNINAATALDPMGNPVPTAANDAGVRNEHDILTGSGPDGRALPASPDVTCAGWTSNAASIPADAGGDGGVGPIAEVGHVNRTGTNAPPANMSWNSSHTTPGCSQADIQRVGGAGRIYCFATN